MHPYRTHTCGALRAGHEGQTVRLSGWVHRQRDHGGVLFLDLRDHYGLTQIVFEADREETSRARELSPELVVTVTGEVARRTPENANPALDTGEVEVRTRALEVRSRAAVLPFPVAEERPAPEAARLAHRFLDLRRHGLHHRIQRRAEIIAFLRRRMTELGFIEIQTPILTCSSPEGARDFLVPSRLHPGQFYSLPRAPQQFKQLLMVSGFDRYFQMAPCFRDEDARADRSPGEFYQLDLEMAFAEQEDVFALSEHLETFLDRARAGEHRVPGHVERELRDYLECGILAYGFVRVRCEDCGESRVVAFSCKRRGFCPSCMGRRMADTAARLTDEILPRVPVRQWVLSLPYEIRYRLAWDGKLVAAVLAVFLRVVYGWYRRQAKAEGHPEPRCGSVTFVQRFGSALNLNPHFHVLVPDGAYVSDEEGRPTFVPAPALTDEAVQAIVETTARRVVRLLERRGLLEPDSTDPYWEDEPLLAAVTAASIQGRVATGERRGERVRRRLVDPEEGVQSGPLCFASRGFSLHAATRVAGPDGSGLERLCRYVMRPPLAGGRLRVVDAEHLSFGLKTPWRDDHPSYYTSCPRW